MKTFIRDLEDNGLVDLGWVKKKFTWSNQHYDETFTKESLDRTVANKAWMTFLAGQLLKSLPLGYWNTNRLCCPLEAEASKV